MSKAKEVVPRNYTDPAFQFILSALAMHGGNCRRTIDYLETIDQETLDQFGVDHWPDHSTLGVWRRDRYAARYAEIRDKTLAPYKAMAAEAHSALADEHLRVNEKALELVEGRLKQMEDKDLIGAMNHTGVQSGIHRDKAGLLRGEKPGEGGGAINVTFNMPELVRGLATSGNRFTDAQGKPLTPDEAVAQAQGKAIEGSATEVTDGES